MAGWPWYEFGLDTTPAEFWLSTRGSGFTSGPRGVALRPGLRELGAAAAGAAQGEEAGSDLWGLGGLRTGRTGRSSWVQHLGKSSQGLGGGGRSPNKAFCLGSTPPPPGPMKPRNPCCCWVFPQPHVRSKSCCSLGRKPRGNLEIARRMTPLLGVLSFGRVTELGISGGPLSVCWLRVPQASIAQETGQGSWTSRPPNIPRCRIRHEDKPRARPGGI